MATPSPPTTAPSPTPAAPSPPTPAAPSPPTDPVSAPASPSPEERAPEPIHRARSPDAYFGHPGRPGYEERLAAALTHLHQHPHWREVVTAAGLLHRGVDIGAESYGPNTRGEAGDVLMRLRAAIPRPRWYTQGAPALGMPVWIAVAGHGVLLACLIATVIALALRK